jgi:hypothetical protein
MKRSREASPEPKAENAKPETEAERLDTRKESLLVDSQEMIDGSDVFQNIVGSIEAGWSKLPDKEKEGMLNAFEELVKKMRNYHESYTKLKGIAKLKLPSAPTADSIKRYQGQVSEADQMERILHNAFLDSINILARTMKRDGLDISWYTQDQIYDADFATMRTKVKHWMFRVFAEKEE